MCKSVTCDTLFGSEDLSYRDGRANSSSLRDLESYLTAVTVYLLYTHYKELQCNTLIYRTIYSHVTQRMVVYVRNAYLQLAS